MPATNTITHSQTSNKSQSRIAKFLPPIKLTKVNHLRSAWVFFPLHFDFYMCSNFDSRGAFCSILSTVNIHAVSHRMVFHAAFLVCINEMYLKCVANFGNAFFSTLCIDAVCVCTLYCVCMYIAANVVENKILISIQYWILLSLLVKIAISLGYFSLEIHSTCNCALTSVYQQMSDARRLYC